MSSKDYSVHYVSADDTLPPTSTTYHKPPSLFGRGRGWYPNCNDSFSLHEIFYL